MKKMFRNIFSVMVCLLLVLALTACSSDVMLSAPPKFDENHENLKESSFVAAENDTYSLNWDSENKRILLIDKVKNVTWSSTPEDRLAQQYDENGVEVNNHPKLNAPIIVEYLETENFNVKQSNAYVNSFNTGTYSIEKITDGFKIIYYFDKFGFSIPLAYTLRNDGFAVSVLPDEITETGKNLVYRVLVEPFLCSNEIGAEDSYLFIPSGSGAIILPDDSSDITVSISEDIYGTDAALNVVANKVKNTESVRLPVFGAKNGDKAICAIVEEGADCAAIDGDISNNTIGYSALYAAFYIRGAQTVIKSSKRTNKYSEQITSSPMTVSYHPLYGEDANYVGMANLYRDYLKANYDLTTIEENSSLALKFIGGSTIRKSVLGIPTDVVSVATTTDDVKNILSDVGENIDAKLVADLVGFGNSGYTRGEIAGGAKVSRKLGGKKGIKSLSSVCAENGIDMYMNFDIVTYNESGLGFNCNFGDAALSTTHQTTRRVAYNYVGGSANESEVYFFLGRKNLFKAADKVLKAASSFKLNGVAFDTLTNYTYSDFADQRYFACAGMKNDVTSILKNFSDKNYRILANDANDYALIASDVALDVPTQSAKCNLYDYEVPFYQIVFKGYKPMFSSSLNYVTDTAKRRLQSIESGSQFSYTVIGNYSTELLKASEQIYCNVVYEDLKENIFENYNSTSDYFKSIAGATITNHEILDKYVRRITYSNGITVYVNYGKTEYASPFGAVAPMGFVYGKEAG